MAWEIVKQPRKQGDPTVRYARFTTVTMSNTLMDLSAPEMIIKLVRGEYCDVEMARRLVNDAAPAKKGTRPYQSGRL